MKTTATSGVLVNGLPIEMVRQWKEHWTKRSFAVSVPTELRRRYFFDDAEFGKAMREAGYVSVKTAKLTGKESRFWLYRVTGNDRGSSIVNVIKINKIQPIVQYSETSQKAFRRLAVDGKWLHVYDDHVRFLTKKRHRVNGVRVQGYTATKVNFTPLAGG